MIQVTIKNDRNENLEDATFSLRVENMPIKSAKIVAEKLPAMIQKAFGIMQIVKSGLIEIKREIMNEFLHLIFDYTSQS